MAKPEDKFLIVTSYDENDPTIATVRMNDTRQEESDKQGYIDFTSLSIEPDNEQNLQTNKTNRRLSISGIQTS